MDTEFWRPWAPAVGQRVRVRVSLECLYCCDPRYRACYERALADDGRLGTIYSIGHDDCACAYDKDEDEDPAHTAHDIWVKWDERRSYDDPLIRIGTWEIPFDAHFALAELIPVEEG